jgi:hypothetical protein
MKGTKIYSTSTRLTTVMTAVGFATAAVCIRQGLAAEPFEAQFQKVAVGLTGEAVIGLVGRPPDSEETTVILTIPETVWRWNGPAGHSYMVLLIKDRVLVTKSCVAVSIC